MKTIQQGLAVALVAVTAAAALEAKARPDSGFETIACQAIEAQAVASFGVQFVIFHYRDLADRGRLGQLLRAHGRTNVQFEVRGGPWRTATVLRLRSCFGRGLLVFAVSGPALARGDDFLIRFPSEH
jgi:hypothetical protein